MGIFTSCVSTMSFIYLLLAVLGLAAACRLSLAVVHGLLIVLASLVVEHGL